MRAALSAFVLFLAACGSSTTERASPAGADLCGAGDLDAICAATPVPLTAGGAVAVAPSIDAGVSYAIAGPGAGQRGYVLFTATVTGEHTLFLGAPEVPFELCEEVATCTSPAPQSCMRSISTYDLIAGEVYELELGPIGVGQRVRLHLGAPGGGGGGGDDARIVFAAMLDGQAAPDLYTIAADGTDRVRVTTTAEAELYPSWSPDQTRIAFVRDNALYAIDPDGGNEQVLAPQAGRERGTAAASWSPDGLELVYTHPREPMIIDDGDEVIDQSYATRLHIVAADGSADRLLYAGQGTLSDPAWSPDGATIAFSAADDCPDCAGGAWFATISANGTGYEEVMPFFTPTNNYPVHGLDWSPAGDRWVYTANADYYRYESLGNIAARSPTADDAEALTTDGAWSPRWSPDGTEIVFLRADGIYSMRANGTGERRIVDVADARGLDW